MSHTTSIRSEEIEGGLDEYTFIHNGDYSGDVTILSPDETSVTVPFQVLAEFVGQKMVNEVISLYEQTSGVDFLAALLAGSLK